MREIADALGYRSHGGVAAAVARMETAVDPTRRSLARIERRLAND